MGVPDHDPNPAKHFKPLPDDVYKSHRQLEDIARMYANPPPSLRMARSSVCSASLTCAVHCTTSLNSPFGPVEIVVIGQRGHGKSALIEALSGHLITHVQLASVR